MGLLGKRRGFILAALAALVLAAGAAGSGPLVPTQVLLTPVADAYVASATPATNFGTSTSLRVDSSPDTRSYLRFDLSGIAAPVVSATLTLTPTAALKAGAQVHTVSDTTWAESGTGGISYNTAPSFDAPVLASTGPVTTGTAVTVDVTPAAVAAAGAQLSLAIVPVSTTAVGFASRETTTKPTLTVTIDPDLQPPVNTAPPTVTDNQSNDPPQSIDTLTASPGTWDPAATAFHYQWRDCVPDLSSCTNVGSDMPTYGLGQGDVGSVVRVLVSASNQAGTGSPAASAPTAPVVQPPSEQTLTFNPVADSYVEGDLPSSNFGTNTKLRMDSSPDVRSYLKFDLTSISSPIVSAALQLVPAANLNAGVELRGVADTTWTERGITYANAPPVGQSTGLSGPVTTNVPVTIDATPAVPTSGGGLVSLALTPRSSTSLTIFSRESSTPPQLIVKINRTLSPPANVGLPEVLDQQANDPPKSGDELRSDVGTWTNSPTAFHFAWQDCSPDLTSCQAVGSDGPSYSAVTTDIGSVVRVIVTASNSAGSSSATSNPTQVVQASDLGHDPVVMAAGDIACGASSTSATCMQGATSNLIVAAPPDVVLPLGDDQYECGSLSDFQTSYDPSWGRVKSITRPVVGNHEYTTSTTPSNPCFNAPTGAPGYYTYFGSLASPLDTNCTSLCKGYYSYNIGTWHMIALNSNCTRIGGCSPGDPQLQWLQADLAAHAGQCTLAYFHHPRFTSGQELDSTFMGPMFQLMFAAHADVILNGHDHDYERFAPLDAAGNVDPSGGIREFVVGTGGRNTTAFIGYHAGSELRDAGSFGVLRMVLHPTGYDWQFLPAAGSSLSDSGSQPCHIAAGADTTAPSAPGAPAAVAVLSHRVDLSWTPASDDIGVVAYRVYRDGTLLTTVGNVRGFTDSGVSATTTYSYMVSAVDASGNASPQTDPVGVTTPATEPVQPIFLDGFESGTMNAWTSLASTTPDSSQSATGRFSAHIVETSSAASAYAQFSPAVNELWLQARFKINSISTMSNLLRLRTPAPIGSGSAGIVTVYVTAGGQLGYRNETSGTNRNSTTIVTTGVWHTLLLHVRVAAPDGAVDTTLDGVAIPALSGVASLGPTTIGRIQIGDAQGGHVFDASYDDVVATSTAPATAH